MQPLKSKQDAILVNVKYDSHGSLRKWKPRFITYLGTVETYMLNAYLLSLPVLFWVLAIITGYSITYIQVYRLGPGIDLRLL